MASTASSRGRGSASSGRELDSRSSATCAGTASTAAKKLRQKPSRPRSKNSMPAGSPRHSLSAPRIAALISARLAITAELPSVAQQLVDRGLGPGLLVHPLDDDRAIEGPGRGAGGQSPAPEAPRHP